MQILSWEDGLVDKMFAVQCEDLSVTPRTHAKIWIQGQSV